MSRYTSDNYSSRYYASTKPIIHDARYDAKYSSRSSSSDSHGSYFSRSTAEYSGRSNTGYCGSSNDSKHKYRVPDNGNTAASQSSRQSTNDASTDWHYVSSTRGGNADTVNHYQGRYDANEPRASEATHAETHRSHKSSSHKSSSHKSSSGSHSHSHSHRKH
jgi:hypothetical protein